MASIGAICGSARKLQRKSGNALLSNSPISLFRMAKRFIEKNGGAITSAVASCPRERECLSIWVWVKFNHQGTANFGPCFHLPGIHFGYLFFDPQPYGLKTWFSGLRGSNKRFAPRIWSVAVPSSRKLPGGPSQHGRPFLSACLTTESTGLTQKTMV